MTQRPQPHELPLLTVTEVARRYHVDQRTLARWVNEGLVTETRTLLGQRRFRDDEVRAALAADEQRADAARREQERLERSHAELLIFLEWLLSLDRPERVEERRRTTLDLIIRRARDVRLAEMRVHDEERK